MTKEQKERYLNNVSKEEKEGFEEYYLQRIKEFGYLYLSSNELPNKDFKQEKIREYFRVNEINKRQSFVLMREIIFEILKEIDDELKMENYLIYKSEKVEVQKVDSLEKFNKVIKTMRKDLFSKTKVVFFRGQGSFGWKIQPSIFRELEWIKNENIMINEMIRYFPDLLSDNKRIDVLTKLQHYGLPTRLLDLTENPLVALFFACFDKEAENEDGRVLVFAEEIDKIKYPEDSIVSVLANISKMDMDFSTNNLKPKEQNFLSYIQEDKVNYTKNIQNNDIIQNCYVKSHINNERIRNQKGLFMIVGTGKEDKQISEIHDSLDDGESIENTKNRKKVLILIDRKKKKSIIEDLRTIGIDESFIFPEIDRVANLIKQKCLKKYN